MKWLQGKKFVMDPNRTPNACKEFKEYEYERDKDGNVISGYPDKNNHLIDAARYATESLWERRGNSA
jgi:phage terminase large subunit